MKKIILLTIIFVGVLGVFTGVYIHSAFIDFKKDVLDVTTVKEEMQVKFFSQAVKMHGTERLQFASLKQIEVIEKKSSKKIKWINLNLPKVIVGAVIPVEYIYYLEFNDKWVMDLKGDSLIVKVPKIHFNQPAVDVSRMQLLVTHSSVFRNEERVLESLKQSITEHLNQRAFENIDIIKETGRKQIESFITKWIVNHYRVEKPEKIEIIFQKELKENL